MVFCSWDSPGKNTGVGCHFLLHICIYIYTYIYVSATLKSTIQTSNGKYVLKLQGSFREPKSKNAEADWSQEVQGYAETRKLSSSLSLNSPPLSECVNHFSLHTSSCFSIAQTREPGYQVHSHLREPWVSRLISFPGLWEGAPAWLTLDRCSPLTHVVQIWLPQLSPFGTGQSSLQRSKNPCLGRKPNSYLPSGAERVVGDKFHYSLVLVLPFRVNSEA